MGAVMAAGTEIEESTAVGMSDVIAAGLTRGIVAFGDCTVISAAMAVMSSRINQERCYQA